MFKSKEKKVNSTKDTKTTSGVTSTQKYNTISIQNSRTINYSSYYSVTQTNSTSSSSSLLRTSALHSSPNLSDLSTGFVKSNIKPRAISVFETDAVPLVQPLNLSKIVNNYQSPFARQLTQYNSTRLSSLQPTTPHNNAVNSVVPTYTTNSKNKGKVLIINNINFVNSQERKGAKVDEKEISNLFKEMGFDVLIHRNLKTLEMKHKIKKFSSDKSLSKVSISVVVIMSHGTNTINKQQIPGSYTLVCGIDDGGVEIDEIVAEFSGEKCSAMKGKPKLFFFQCCRGEKTELKVDAVPIKPVVKAHADVLIAYSTLPGFYSVRDEEKGTWYIQSICDVFRKHYKDFDVETLLKIVDEQLSKKHPEYVQTSVYESRGFKRCFLYPR
ncbi:caspase-7-like [Diorhabda carinulata]|uniref:caspase-7-like n=1 Tax=Diorhabda carinulata TaxID=1163345 RepID=UPI0025A1ACF0|nr:caspase-7-like [Diorhabda carinulata]